MAHRCLAMMDQGGQCAVISDAGGGGKAAISITKSVGKNAANLQEDVKLVQGALNDVGPTQGGPLPPLAVDGLCWGKTVAAIHKFQATFMQWPDDRVDPGGKTLARLNAIRRGGALMALGAAGTGTPEALLPNPYVVPMVLSLMPELRKCLKAAETELMLAMPVIRLAKGSPQRQARMSRINLHFAIDSFPNPAVAFNEVYANIKRCTLAIARHHDGPEAQFMGIFEANRSEKMEKDSRAYTFAGGYHRVGTKDPTMKIRMDLIYICSRLARNSRDFQIMAMVHELAHFVGGESVVDAIDDYGYGWIDDPRMKRLVPWQRTHNAQSYGNFAFQCAFNRSPFGPGDLGGPKDK